MVTAAWPSRHLRELALETAIGDLPAGKTVGIARDINCFFVTGAGTGWFTMTAVPPLTVPQ